MSRFKDSVKRDAISFDIDFSSSKDLADDREQLKNITAVGLKS